ncbi:peptidoglycan-binding protein [Hyalangium sp.]|uniref:peptidoglycan-binding protein n=1 Tax=Hyalangium sp. TaxID=2028555 RepID=UPI002D4BA4E0|nr:peptidoglycan-binding protein [Hyalangium sp.]HYI01957.1 peptidoglycan-binding protein [Hyalangium sp.]
MTTTSSTRSQSSQSTQSTRSTSTTTRAASNPNAILSKYQPTGASSATARQDGLPGGVASSQKMARTDLTKMKKYADEFAAAGKKHNLPPALLAAIASRESRGGSALDSRGFGDHGNGFGLMQVDKRFHSPKGGPFSAAHIDQAAGILKSYHNQIKAKHPDWPPEQQLRGAVAAYNSGPGNVQTIKNMDKGTTGNDYSTDVWARAQELAPHFGGSTGSAGGTGGTGGSTKPSKPSGGSAPTLREGSKGSEVKSLQSKLEKLGFELGSQDGAFGPKTEAAVKRFQGKHNLEVDGIAGPKTHAALEKALAARTEQAKLQSDSFDRKATKWKDAPALADVKSGKEHLQQGMEGGSVKHLQKLLGLETDGKFGPDTKKAVAAFQKDHRLDVGDAAGSVGPKTLAAMEKAAKSSGGGAIDDGRGWGGSEGVADAAKAIAREMGIPVTSQKRNLADTKRVGSTTGSDHYTGNKNAFATDFGVAGARGDQLARAIAKKYGIPASNIGTYNRHTINVDGQKYSLQLLWKVKGHFDHVHLGIQKH